MEVVTIWQTSDPSAPCGLPERAGDIRELTCPPYDIISESQRLSYLARNPHNIIRLELPRDGADPYAAAGETLRSWLEEGILRQDDEAAFYVYEIEFDLEGMSDISGMAGGRRSIVGLIRSGASGGVLQGDCASA